MPNYRRNFVAGGGCFFIVNLLEQQSFGIDNTSVHIFSITLLGKNTFTPYSANLTTELNAIKNSIYSSRPPYRLQPFGR